MNTEETINGPENSGNGGDAGSERSSADNATTDARPGDTASGTETGTAVDRQPAIEPGNETGQSVSDVPGADGNGAHDASGESGRPGASGNGSGSGGRKRGRPRKQPGEAAASGASGQRGRPANATPEPTAGTLWEAATLDAGLGAPSPVDGERIRETQKPARKRAPRKNPGQLSGDQVADGVTHLFKLVAMLPGNEHWRVDRREVEPWADEAAQLLGRVPMEAVDRIVDASAVVTVGVGVATMVAPRIAITGMKQKLRAQERALANQAAAPVASGEQVQADMAAAGETLDSDISGRPTGRIPGVFEGI